MKPALPSLVNYLNSNDDVVLVDLYTILLQGGETLRFMDYPLVTLTIPGTNFPGSPLNTGSGNLSFVRGPRVGRSKVSTKVGIEPAEITVEIYPATGTTLLEPADLIGTFTWQEYGDAGGFDGAHLELDRLFLPIGGDGVRGPLDLSLGAIVWFYGIVAEVEVSRSKVEIKTKALINLLQQQQMPRRLFQSGCTHIFGDAMCGYNRVAGQNALGVPTGIGQTVINVIAGSNQGGLVAPSNPASFYIQGTATGQSGQNAGLSRGISNVVGAIVYLAHPFPFPVAVGDQFQLLPGCDHTSTGSNGCTARQNLLRYGGFDYIPPPELAL